MVKSPSNPSKPMVFPWFPMVFPWFSHGFPMVFPWFSHPLAPASTRCAKGMAVCKLPWIRRRAGPRRPRLPGAWSRKPPLSARHSWSLGGSLVICLVVDLQTPLKNMMEWVKVSWEGWHFQLIWKVIQNSMVPVSTNQSEKVIFQESKTAKTCSLSLGQSWWPSHGGLVR